MPLFYTLHYFSDAQNHLRHEYIEGAIVSVFVGTWFWVVAAVVLMIIKLVFSRTKSKKKKQDLRNSVK